MSNVFNDVLELDSGNGNITLLKGIAARSDVGFLSLFEHYNACQVPGAPLPATSGEGGENCGNWGAIALTEGLGRSAALCHRVLGTGFTPRACRSVFWERLWERGR